MDALGRIIRPKNYQAAWRNWGKEYGSSDAAEELGFESAAAGVMERWMLPKPKQLFDGRRLGGGWRSTTGILDEFIAGRYGGAADLVRAIDPNHFVSVA